MTTVPNDVPEDSPAGLLNFAKSVFREGHSTWWCQSWIPWIRYVLTIFVVVIAVIILAGGLAHLLPLIKL